MVSGKRLDEQTPSRNASEPSSPSALLSDIPLLLLIRIRPNPCGLAHIITMHCDNQSNKHAYSRINDAGNGRIFYRFIRYGLRCFNVKHLYLDETGIAGHFADRQRREDGGTNRLTPYRVLRGRLTPSLGATETRRCARRTPHRSYIASIANRRDKFLLSTSKGLAPKRVQRPLQRGSPTPASGFSGPAGLTRARMSSSAMPALAQVRDQVVRQQPRRWVVGGEGGASRRAPGHERPPLARVEIKFPPCPNPCRRGFTVL